MDQTKPKNTGLYIALAIILIIIVAFALIHKKTSAPSDTGTPTPTGNLGTVQNPTDSDVNTSHATPTTTTGTAAETHVVTYTDSGFSPATVTIHPGDEVQFINNSTHTMWVASDPHPQHTDLPGFDALKGYAIGTTYSFTFLTPGSWGYHDHLHASMDGTVIVQ